MCEGCVCVPGVMISILLDIIAYRDIRPILEKAFVMSLSNGSSTP